MSKHFARNGLAAVLSVTLVTGLNPAVALAYDKAVGPSAQQGGALSAASLVVPSELTSQDDDINDFWSLELDSYDVSYSADELVFPSFSVHDQSSGDVVDAAKYTSKVMRGIYDYETGDYEYVEVAAGEQEPGGYILRVEPTAESGLHGQLDEWFNVIDYSDISSLWYFNLNSDTVDYSAGELVFPAYSVVENNGDSEVDSANYTCKVMKEVYDDDTGMSEYVEVAAGEQEPGRYYLRIEPTVESGLHGYLQEGFYVVDRFDVRRLDIGVSRSVVKVGEIPDDFGPQVYEYGYYEDNDHLLVEGVDYTTSYQKNTSSDDVWDGEWVDVDSLGSEGIGYYRFVVTGIDNYHGVGYSEEFTLVDPYDVKCLNVSIDDKWYSNGWRLHFFSDEGVPAGFSPTVYEYGSYYDDVPTLVKDVDYTVSYQKESTPDGEWTDIDAFDGKTLGCYRFKVTGIGKYHGSNYSGQFEVVSPNDLRFADIGGLSGVVIPKGQTYTPEPTVSCRGKTLQEGVDYKVTYYTGIYDDWTWDILRGEETSLPLTADDAGAYRYYVAVIEGIGNCVGSKEVSFRVLSSNSLRAAKLELNRTEYPYTGNPVALDYTLVSHDGTPLVEGKDFKLIYGVWDELGGDQDEGALYDQSEDAPIEENGWHRYEYGVYAKGMGDYSGETYVALFHIVSANSLKAATIQFADPAFASSHEIAYTGQKEVPQFSVVLPAENGDITLVEGQDYTVEYSHWVSEEDGEGYTWQHRETIESPTEPDTYTVTIEGIGYDDIGYTGEIWFNYSIRKSLANAKVTVADQEYTGKELTPDVTVTLDGEVVPASQYKVTYTDNVEAGTATVTVTAGLPDDSEDALLYMGSATGTFQINASNPPAPTSIADAVISGVSDATYTGSPITQDKLAVTLGGKILALGTDYTVAYADNVNAGTATVTVTGTDNYAGTATATFAIAPASIAGAKLKLSATKYTFTGKVQKPTVKAIGGKALKEGTDYTVAYSSASSKAAGTYTVTVTGKGNYAGTSAKASYTIARAKTPMTATVKTKSVKLAKVKKKAQTVASAIAVSKAKGKVTYAKVEKGSSKNLTVNKTTGKITVKKGTKKGTYKIKVKVTDAGNANYLKGTKTVTVTVKVVK